VSQPRKIAAITIAKRISQERKSPLGYEVGFQVALNKMMNKNEDDATKLLFCTTGVILEKIINRKSIEYYSHIIIDEIHQRDTDTDLLIKIIKDFMSQSPKTKLILMSATIFPKLFLDYFQNFDTALVATEKMERKFITNVLYLDDFDIATNDRYVDYNIPSISIKMFRLACDYIEKHFSESNKSILVFLPGFYEIESMKVLLFNKYSLQEKCEICMLHSSMPAIEQNITLQKSSLPKVILSTNIAESSLTIRKKHINFKKNNYN
jgi:ATP-dependent RNA helicase TDRD9